MGCDNKKIKYVIFISKNILKRLNRLRVIVYLEMLLKRKRPHSIQRVLHKKTIRNNKNEMNLMRVCRIIIEKTFE